MQIPDDIYQSQPTDRRRQQRDTLPNEPNVQTWSLIRPGSWRGALQPRLQPLWRNWISRRLPAARHIILNQRSIFIFPTVAGFGFLGYCFSVCQFFITYSMNLLSFQ